MTNVTRGLAIVMGLALCAGMANAATMVDDTWNLAGLDGWSATDTLGTPGTSLAGGVSLGDQTGLEITGNPGGNFADTEVATGDWGATFGSGDVRSIRFDFYAGQANSPSFLQLFFSTGTYTWYYQIDVTGIAAGDWNSYAVNLMANTDPGGWYSFTRTPTEFQTDLANATDVGILLSYTVNSTLQTYGLDNFELNDEYLVPEPSTYAALGVALLSLALVFRRRISETMMTAKQAITA